jgi:alpha-amylase
MPVMLQSFHWDCPRVDSREFGWWNHVRERVPALAQEGFSSLWLPPVHKAGNVFGQSMGYDPYDYYDLGEFNQRDAVPTWFGSRTELEALIADAHSHGLSVLADLVINHNNGADEQEVNPIDGESRWTKFAPKSGKFVRDWECFHPCRFETWDLERFGGMPDLSHRNPKVYAEVMELVRWLVEEIGFDGFRYDFVKGYGSWLVTAIQEYRYVRDGAAFRPYGVAENWSGTRSIDNWINETNAWNDNPVDAFDFPLRELLKQLCDSYGFSLRGLAGADTLLHRCPGSAVTFVENHDLQGEGAAIVHDKLLAYAYILTHEAHPCVFWRDYYNFGLAKGGTPHGISALVRAHEAYAGGASEVLWVDDDLYVMQRSGHDQQPGLILALNNRGDRWNGGWVSTRWHNVDLVPVAWWSGSDLSRPQDQRVFGDGRAEVWAPPRGYVVYAPLT